MDAIAAILDGESVSWNGQQLMIQGAVMDSNGVVRGYNANRLVQAVSQVSEVVLQLKTIQAIKETLAVQSEQAVGSATVLTVEL